jgi:hypothetical protein
MATTTTNFGWDIPQSTDLVKDGATAIAALGQDIDTAFIDLKGGTTGQVLAKASGTDLDFSWVAQDDSNAIQNAIVDAKGDLIAATANDTPARLAVGTNGHVLTADSTEATGIKWSAPTAGALTLIATASPSASASVSIDNCFTSTYTNYLIIANVTATSADTLKIRLRASSTDNTSSNYVWNQAYQYIGGATSAFTTASSGQPGTATSFELGYVATGGENVHRINLNSPQATANTSFDNVGLGVYTATNYLLSAQNRGVMTVTTAYDGFTIFPTSGNLTGTIKVYGIGI